MYLWYCLQGFKKAVSEVRLCSRMEELLLKKKSIHPGDSLETHFEKAWCSYYFKINFTSIFCCMLLHLALQFNRAEESKAFLFAKTYLIVLPCQVKWYMGVMLMCIYKTLQVDKLKVLSESLANSSAKAEKRIMENRFISWSFFVLYI